LPSLVLRDLIPVALNQREEGYPPFFDLNLPDEHSDRAIPARAGTAATGVDVAISKVHTRRIRGSVVDSAGGLLVRSAQIFLLAQKSVGDARRIIGAVNGSFDLQGVLPGSYFLAALSADRLSVMRGRAILDIGSTDVNDLRIPVTTGFSLSGRVVIEDRSGSANTSVSGIQVTLKPDRPARETQPTVLQAKLQGLSL